MIARSGYETNKLNNIHVYLSLLSSCNLQCYPAIYIMKKALLYQNVGLIRAVIGSRTFGDYISGYVGIKAMMVVEVIMTLGWKGLRTYQLQSR